MDNFIRELIFFFKLNEDIRIKNILIEIKYLKDGFSNVLVE